MPTLEEASSPPAAAVARALPAIPTADAAAALRFCQALAQLAGPGVEPLAQPPAGPAATGAAAPQISVVIPAYNEQENIPLLYERLVAALEGLGESFEIVVVNDGSRDRTLAILHELAARDQRFVAVDLARNFGHQIAISAGMAQARGQAVIIMDADLQDPPEVLGQFIARWREGFEVVYAIREKRKEGLLKRAAYSGFYRLLKRVAQIDIPLDAGDFCIMDRKVVDLLVRMPERNRFVRGIRSWVGFRQVGLAYERQARHAGRPKYTLTRLIYLALDGLISFSFLPLRLISIAGIVVSLLSTLIAAFYAVQKLTVGLNPPGFATIVVAIFFFAGVQLITLGVIGEYIGRIFEEVKNRPLYVIREVRGAGRG
jgi:dolichol-phosphate mannosyltransferase